MLERRHRFIDAAIRYQNLLDEGQLLSLDEFVAQEPADLRDALRDYLEMTLTLGDLSDTVALSPAEQARADRAEARARARFAQFQTASQPQTLVALRTARKLSLGAVAKQVNLPPDLLARIERGAVLAATVPERLVDRLAATLEQTAATIRAALSTPVGAPTGVRHSAQDGALVLRETGTPYETAVSFAEALHASSASDAQRVEWDGETT